MGYAYRQLPFITRSNPKSKSMNKEIKENGKYNTMAYLGVDVKVAEAGELTPEAEQEILNEEY